MQVFFPNLDLLTSRLTFRDQECRWDTLSLGALNVTRMEGGRESPKSSVWLGKFLTSNGKARTISRLCSLTTNIQSIPARRTEIDLNFQSLIHHSLILITSILIQMGLRSLNAILSLGHTVSTF